jgi:hypothetical protein
MFDPAVVKAGRRRNVATFFAAGTTEQDGQAWC